MIKQAFILGAGFGTRMMPLSADKPKPMVVVHGKPIIDHILDHLIHAGIRDVVINAHAHAAVLEEHLAGRSDIRVHLSHEERILNTGGGLQTGLPLLPNPDAPFFAINGDAFWQGKGSLQELSAQWESLSASSEVDILLMLQDITRMPLTQAVGDYTIAPDHRAIRCPAQDGTHMFTGIRILHPRCMTRPENQAFSFLDLMDEAQDKGHLYAHDHTGLWHHISTPDDVANVTQVLQTETQPGMQA